jgi:hypothetical protein
MHYEIVTGTHEPVRKTFEEALTTGGVYLVSIDPEGSLRSYINTYDYFLIVPADDVSSLSCIMVRIKRETGTAYTFSLTPDNWGSFTGQAYIPTNLTFGVSLYIKEETNDL